MALKDRSDYHGPGWQDWLVSAGGTFLIAAEFRTQGARDTLQSAASYYFEQGGVQLMHSAALAIDGSLLVLAVVWITTRHKAAAQRAMVVIAAAGFALCWWEIIFALQSQADAVYVLTDLPFRPVNNLGVIGAQIFGSYLILKTPSGRLKPVPAVAVKVGLAVCLWLFQSVVWRFGVPQ